MQRTKLFCSSFSVKPLFPTQPCCSFNQRTTLFRKTFTRQQQQQQHGTSATYNRPKLFAPFCFTVGVGGFSFGACAIVQYERTRNHSTLRNHWDNFKKRTSRMQKEFDLRERTKQWWDGLGEARRMAAVLIGINVAVLGAWRVASSRGFMERWFTHSPSDGRVAPLLLSCFSHMEVWHCGANMYVLWSFAPLIHEIMGSEQLAAFYITGGCFSSLASHYFKVASRAGAVASLGASGALLAVLAACCVKRPDAQLQIIFLPFLTFSAQAGLMGVIALDVCGLLFKWRLFDHAAHLGGNLFGCWYVTYGHTYLWDQRAPLIRKWHEMRKSWSDD